MAEPAQICTNAFRWLDANMVASADTPDEAFDWVFMLKPDDWARLEAIWHDRPPAWREACAYIVGEGPLVPSQRLLRLALADDNNDVAEQAAISFCAQLLDHPDEASLDISLIPRLQEIRRRRKNTSGNEVDAILRQSGVVG